MTTTTTLYRSATSVFRVIAAAARTKDVPVVEEGFFGWPTADALINEEYALDCRQVERLIDIDGTNIPTPVRGDLIYITSGNVLTKTSGGNRLVARISETRTSRGVPVGKIAVLVLPQNS